MTGNRRRGRMFEGGIDLQVVFIYLVLVVMGWMSIYSSSFVEGEPFSFGMGRLYGVQMIWIGVSLFIAASILLIDAKYYHILAYPLYIFAIVALLGVFVLGKEVKGAMSWYEIGSIRIQPTEFVKFTTALALARSMSSYSFNVHHWRSILNVAIIVGIPVAIILLQNDTGSAIVYGAFAFVLFREGFNGWVYVSLFLLVALFVLSFWLEPATLLIFLLLACVICEGAVNGRWREKIIYTAGVAALTAAVYFAGEALTENGIGLYVSIIIAVIISLVAVFIYAYRNRIRNIVFFVLLFFGSLGFTKTIDYVFDNVLQIHQQKRILDLLGIESDLKKWGYNVNQSKIAIGSGGFSGKGYLNGTQTKYDFVPEQSTDFIFCTVGEEWGFVGSTVVVIMFSWLILRLVGMGDRQSEPFGRIYCYCVASLFFMHFIVNIGMTIGLMPVIGIPLPFFSYGGSSLIAFTVLLFVAVKLDSSRKRDITIV